jgi:quinol-cytochrome oxidoreductase complex cytochrome b subunit
MKSIKRILAIIAVIFLLSLIGLTVYAALTSSPNSHALFQACIYSIVVIPIMIYAYMLVYRLVKKNGQDINYSNKEDNKDTKKDNK